jgi:hypothetical protein
VGAQGQGTPKPERPVTRPSRPEVWIPDLPPPPRVPDPGSQPQVRSADRQSTGVAAPDSFDSDSVSSGWTFMPDPEVGARLMVAGLIALVFCVGGLVTVAVRRRQW